MSTFGLAPRSMEGDPVTPRRVNASILWYVLVEALTWLFLIGMVGTVSAGQFGSSSYTLAVAAAGIAVSFIRRGGAHRQTLFTALMKLLTLFLVVGVASNPLRNGLMTVVIALAAWVAVEGLRARLGQPTTIVSAVVQLAILIGVGVAIDGRAAQDVFLPGVLVAWAAVELAWGLIIRALPKWRPLNYSLTRRQVALVTTTCIAILAALIVSVIVNYTTVQYYGRTVSMTSLWTQESSPYCITYAWKVAGVNLSAIGLGGPTECFDTEAELRQVAATHEWVGRRGFSNEAP